MIWFWRKKKDEGYIPTHMRTDVWMDGFKDGFSKGIDIKSLEMKDLINKIEEESIKKAVDRLRKK